MSREEQISEMVKVLNEATFGVNEHTLADHLSPDIINKVAEFLYNAGYRKQSQDIGENIFLERLKKNLEFQEQHGFYKEAKQTKLIIQNMEQ